MKPAAERVARGAKLLDEKAPGWHYLIQLDELKMSSCHTCILGQLFGPAFEACVLEDSGIPPFVEFGNGYREGCYSPFDIGKFAMGAPSDDLEDTDAWVELHGFITGSSDTEYAELTALWAAEIAKRDPF